MKQADRSQAPDEPGASPLLAELRKAHADLSEAIDELGRLTFGPVPSKERLVDTRWKISRASLSRRLLWGRILMSVSPRASASDRDELRRLQELDIDLLRASTAHVGKWTAQTVLDDWRGYRRASRIMRSKMEAGIAAEQQTLYPILRRMAS